MHKLLPASVALALATPFGALGRHRVRHQGASTGDRNDARHLRSAPAGAGAAPEVRRSGPLRHPLRRLQPPPLSLRPPPVRQPRSPPVVAASGGSANAFNPAISLILSGLYTRTSQDPASYAITGFQLPGRRVRARLARLQPRRIRARLLRQHRSVAARRGQHRAASRRLGLGRGGLRPDHVARQRLLAEGRPFLLGHRLPQPAARAHAGTSSTTRWPTRPCSATQYGDDGLQLTWLAPHGPVHRAGRRGRPRPQLSGQRHRAQRRRDDARSPHTPAATSAPATAGAPACRC